MTTIGILSDNHGDWPPHIAKALSGVDAIIHAGDIGPYHIISAMEAIAPTTAVLGNTDGDMPINEECLNEQRFAAYWIVRSCLGEAPGQIIKQTIVIVKKPSTHPPSREPKKRAMSARPC